ncbi:putative tail fiber protein [Bacillus phage BCD7]|uniref:Putative tail fiber protein n=1 Tax=Bacillus phage BCD7 TaxID=1136534 RepID=J9PUL9_9CAUD|nr:putative tail fiber protein [Bacillus phage BCD7]AEZ50526.1 putative tail fiber protein [Bacillus phage BCD7]
MPHTVDFSVPDKFKKEKAFTQVKFGQDGHLLEVELNEMQKIALEKIRAVTRASFGDRALKGGTMTVSGASLTVKDKTVVVNGDIINIENVVLTVATGNTVYVATNEIEITAGSKIKKDGNTHTTNEEVNNILDPRIGEESSRRIQLTYTLTTTKPVSGNYIELCKIAGTAGSLTVTPSTYEDTASQIEVVDIINRYNGLLSDLMTDEKGTMVGAVNDVLKKFNTHNSDTVKHVTSAERTAWNAKETPEGAQSKANQAETNAKNASIPKTGDSTITGKLTVTNGIRPMITGKNGADSITTYPQGISFQALGGQETGFPSPFGEVITFMDSEHRNFQIYHEKAKDTIQIRTYNGDTKAWQAWTPLETSAEVDRKIKVHTDDNVRHITSAERTAWNAKADRSTTYSKTETDTKINEVLGMNQELLNTIKEITEQLGNNESAVGAIMTSLDNKVDKVAGKGLSTNDYTTAEKNKLAGLSNYSLPIATASVLGGIKSGRDLVIQTDGTVEIADNSHAHTIDNITGLQSALNNKASLNHNHDTAYTASGNTIYSVQAGDVRTTTPTQFGATAPTKYKEVQFLFTGLNNVANSPYADAMVFSTYQDQSGGKINMLLLDKSQEGVYLQQGAFDGATWNAKRKLAFLDEVVDTKTFKDHADKPSIHKDWGQWRTNGGQDLLVWDKRAVVGMPTTGEDKLHLNYGKDFKNGVNINGPVKIDNTWDVIHAGWNIVREQTASTTVQSDWNAIITTGNYNVSDATGTRHASTPPNCYPYGTLEVYRNTSEDRHLFQRYTSHTGAQVFVRSAWNRTSWSAWKRLTDDEILATELAKQVTRAGDTMTGDLTMQDAGISINKSYQDATGATKWYKRKVIQASDADQYGMKLVIEGGGPVIIGAGEGALATVAPNVATSAENMFVTADADIYFLANVNTAWEDRKEMVFNRSGNLLVPGNISEGGTNLSAKYAGYNVKINSGAGLLGGSNIGTDTTLSVNFGGNGSATQVARSDHNHDTVYAKASHGNHVPNTETANGYRFLRNDNTWQNLPTAATGNPGIVQLTDASNSTSVTQAPTANALKRVFDTAEGLKTSKAEANHNHDSVYAFVKGDTFTGSLTVNHAYPLISKVQNKKSWTLWNDPSTQAISLVPSKSVNAQDWDVGNSIQFQDNGTVWGNYIRGGTTDKSMLMGVGASDAYITNTKSGKYLQLRDDGILSYAGDPVTLKSHWGSWEVRGTYDLTTLGGKRAMVGTTYGPGLVINYGNDFGKISMEGQVWIGREKENTTHRMQGNSLDFMINNVVYDNYITFNSNGVGTEGKEPTIMPYPRSGYGFVGTNDFKFYKGYTSAGWIQASDRKIKGDIQVYDDEMGYNALKDLSIYTYHYTDRENSENEMKLGTMADELPFFVLDKDGETFDTNPSVDIYSFASLVASGTKHNIEKTEAQEERIDALETENAELKNTLAEVLERLAKLEGSN